MVETRKEFLEKVKRLASPSFAQSRLAKFGFGECSQFAQ